MKAVVLEVRGKEAVVLTTDGEIIKIKQNNYKTGDTIELSEKQAKGKTIPYREIWKYGSMAAAAALILGCGGTYSYNNVVACSYVSLDAEPSIEYTLNRKNLVLDVTALNEEAAEIVEDLKDAGVKQNTLSEAMEKTAELLEKYGYMDADETDYVLINVSCDSEKQRDLLKEEASTVFDNINKTDSEAVNVTVTESSVSDRKNAKSLGISSGEYQEIKKIKENETATSKPEISADDIDKYSGLGVQELLESSGQLEKKSEQTGVQNNSAKSSGNGRSQSDKGNENAASQKEADGSAQSSENPAESRNADEDTNGTDTGKTGDATAGKEAAGNTAENQETTTENQKNALQNSQNNADGSSNKTTGNSKAEAENPQDNNASNTKETPQNNIQPETPSATTSDNSHSAAPSESSGNNGSAAPSGGNNNGGNFPG